MKIEYFDYAAVIILCCLIITGYLKKSNKGKVNRSFYYCCWVTLLTAIAGSFAVALDNSGPGYVIEKYLAHSIYLTTHNMTAVFFLFYVVTMTDTWYKIRRYKWLNVVLFTPISVLCILMTVNIFTDCMFYINEEGVYTRAWMFNVVYVIGVYYFLFNLVYIIWFRKLFSNRKIVTLVVFYFLMVLSVVLEYLYPNLVIELFFNAIGGLVIALTIQSPEERVDFETRLLNQTAYLEDCRKIYLNQKPAKELIVNFMGFRSNMEILGFDTSEVFVRDLAMRIEKICTETSLSEEIYYLKNGQFRCHVNQVDYGHITIATRRMYTELRHPFTYGNVSVCLTPCICIADIIGDFNRVEDLMNFGRQFGKREDCSQVIEARNLLKDNYYKISQRIDSIIEEALANNEFRVFYQPIYSIKERRYIAAEALLRLKHPEYGFISPEFIVTAAEKSGSIHRIGEYVLRTVCNFITSDDFKALGIDYIEVNLSAAQCIQDSLDTNIEELLQDYGVRPEQINLEITETAMIHSEARMIENLNKLSARGIKFSLDDFGSGYSNIQRMSALPLSIVKIDKSFIHENTENERLDIILENMVHMIKALDLKIVVEGVETAETLKQFEILECDYIQGYYFSRPLPEEEFMKTVMQKNGVCFVNQK